MEMATLLRKTPLAEPVQDASSEVNRRLAGV
jgi:hypothetical protein